MPLCLNCYFILIQAHHTLSLVCVGIVSMPPIERGVDWLYYTSDGRNVNDDFEKWLKLQLPLKCGDKINYHKAGIISLAYM